VLMQERSRRLGKGRRQPPGAAATSGRGLGVRARSHTRRPSCRVRVGGGGRRVGRLRRPLSGCGEAG
jgi:hypothetical protein